MLEKLTKVTIKSKIRLYRSIERENKLKFFVKNIAKYKKILYNNLENRNNSYFR